MDAKTLEALKASIAKWERNAKAKDVDKVRMGMTDCPLCKLFHSWRGGPDCKGCPVNATGDHYRCGGTPYDDLDIAFWNWTDDAGRSFRAKAKVEVTFLKSLLPTEG